MSKTRDPKQAPCETWFLWHDAAPITPLSLLTDVGTLFESLGERPTRVRAATVEGKLERRRYTQEGLAGLASLSNIGSVAIMNRETADPVEVSLFLRDHPSTSTVARGQFERWISVRSTKAIQSRVAVLRFLERATAGYPVVHGAAMRSRDWNHASAEIYLTCVGSRLGPGEATRTHFDAMNIRLAHRKLRRLYPITIIGPAIWAQLPPMPAFDPMPTVEELGDCKIVTAWPELCDPRDPAFLRGTRALREWLWPYTIQNPADHVDNDPPCADVAT